MLPSTGHSQLKERCSSVARSEESRQKKRAERQKDQRGQSAGSGHQQSGECQGPGVSHLSLRAVELAATKGRDTGNRHRD